MSSVARNSGFFERQIVSDYPARDACCPTEIPQQFDLPLRIHRHIMQVIRCAVLFLAGALLSGWDQEQSFESSDAAVEKSGFIPDLQKHGSPCGFEGRRDAEWLKRFRCCVTV